MVWQNTMRGVAMLGVMVAMVAPTATQSAHAGDDPPCEPAWVPTFGGERGMDATVYALQDYDDGTGEALYAGGAFTQAGLLATKGIAKWDGHEWSALGAGLHGTVYSMTVFDDGAGPALYAGGLFALEPGEFNVNIAKWDGSQWTSVGAGISGTVYALAVFDDGTGNGEELYAGGAIHSSRLERREQLRQVGRHGMVGAWRNHLGNELPGSRAPGV